MPIHDWTRVPDGIFHDFHSRWLTHLAEALNAGILPQDYYAISEQIAGELGPDVLTLQENGQDSQPTSSAQGARGGPQVCTLTVAAPEVRFTVKDEEGSPRRHRRRLVIRHVSDDRIITYVRDPVRTAYVEPVSVGDVLRDMPLFLDPVSYIKVPLQATYQQAWAGVPHRWRRVLEGPAP